MVSLASQRSEVVRTIKIVGTTEGIDGAKAKLDQLAGATKAVAVASTETSRATLSAESAYRKLAMSIDPAYRETTMMAKAQRDLTLAQQQGIITTQRQTEMMALASKRYGPGGALPGLAGGAGSLLGGLGIGLGIAELSKIPGEITNIVHEVAGLSHLAETIGITTKQLQELQYAGAQVHLTTETMNAALEKFSKNLGEAQTGTGTLAKIFATNHIKISGDVTKDFETVANLVQHATNAEQKNLITTAAFGKTAEEMGLLFKGGAAGIREAMDEADRIGAVISDDKINRIAELDKKFVSLATTLEIAFKEAVIDGVFAVGSLAGKMNDLSKSADDVWSNPNFRNIMAFAFGKGAISSGPLAQLISGYEGTPVSRGSDASISYSSGFAGMLGSPRQAEDASMAALSNMRATPTDTDLARQAAAAAAQKKFDQALLSVQKATVALQAQAATFGMAAGPAAEYQKQQELINVAQENLIALTPDVLKKIDAQAKAYGEAAAQLEKMQAAATAEQFLAQSLYDAVAGAKSLSDAFGKLANSIAQAVVQAALLGQGPLAGLMGTTSNSGGLLGSLIGGLFGIGGPTFYGSTAGGQLYHSGGLVGSSSAPWRNVHPAYFDDAPRLHGGLASDEFPAILQRGERVLSRSQVAGGGQGGTNINLIINNTRSNDTDVRQRSTTGPNGPQMVIDIVKKGFAGGEFDSPMRARFGARPQKVTS